MEDLQFAQREDKEIGPIIELLEANPEQPPWEAIALKSSATKILWQMWPRLAMIEGSLRRRFDEVDGKTVRWPIVLPEKISHGVHEDCS